MQKRAGKPAKPGGAKPGGGGKKGGGGGGNNGMAPSPAAAMRGQQAGVVRVYVETSLQTKLLMAVPHASTVAAVKGGPGGGGCRLPAPRSVQLQLNAAPVDSNSCPQHVLNLSRRTHTNPTLPASYCAAEAARRHQLQYPEHGQVAVQALAVPADALAAPAGGGNPAFFPAFDEDGIIGGCCWPCLDTGLLGAAGCGCCLCAVSPGCCLLGAATSAAMQAVPTGASGFPDPCSPFLLPCRCAAQRSRHGAAGVPAVPRAEALAGRACRRSRRHRRRAAGSQPGRRQAAAAAAASGKAAAAAGAGH